MPVRFPARRAAGRTRRRRAAAVSLLPAALLLGAAQANAFTPSRHEACCRTVLQGRPDPALCSEGPPSVQACTEVIDAMARAAAARHAHERVPEAAPEAARTVTHGAAAGTARGVVGWIGVALAAALAVVALRWIGARRIVRFAAAAAAFATVTLGAAWGLWTAGCAYLRCVDTMGLGILIVALVPATAIAAWAASRVWRRLAPSRR